jgi:hypothetical protein
MKEALSPERLDALRGLFEGWRRGGLAGVTVSAVGAQSVVNGWLLTVLPDRFVAGERGVFERVWLMTNGLTILIPGEERL